MSYRSIIFENVTDFDPGQIFECGQAFRWNKNGEYYEGVADSRIARIIYGKNEQKLTVTVLNPSVISDNTDETEKAFWSEYFDLGRNYSEIKEKLGKTDENMAAAVEYGGGIRILHQDPFEMLISFIISAQNNIPRIKTCIEKLCAAYGKKLVTEDEERRVFYAFPEPVSLAEATAAEISGLTHAGYRCPYIVKSSQMYTEKPFSRDTLSAMSIESAQKRICEFCGVGPKVCDCILLFTGARDDVFPVDVWIRRVMISLYIKEDVSNRKIYEYAVERFGRVCGIAQQYLFFYGRENL